MTRYYMVKYIRRPRVARAWGKVTKTHRLFLVFADRDEARAVYLLWRKRAAEGTRGRILDFVFLKLTDEAPSGVSVEEAQRGLYSWKRVK